MTEFPDASSLTEAERTWATSHQLDLDRYAGLKNVRNSHDMAALERHLAERSKAVDNGARIAELRAEIEALGGTA